MSKRIRPKFPAARIKKIMQTDEEVGKIARETPMLVSRAIELFIEQLVGKTAQITISKNAKTLTGLHLKECVTGEEKFDFLVNTLQNVPDVEAPKQRKPRAKKTAAEGEGELVPAKKAGRGKKAAAKKRVDFMDESDGEENSDTDLPKPAAAAVTTATASSVPIGTPASFMPVPTPASLGGGPGPAPAVTQGTPAPAPSLVSSIAAQPARKEEEDVDYDAL